MATLSDRLNDDLKTAMKAQDRFRLDALRMLKAAIQKVQIDKRKDALDDAEVTQILSQQAKQRRESLDAAKQSGRQELITQAEQELALLQQYLPKALSTDELKALIDDAFTTHGPNQGLIMKQVMTKAAGAADGKQVSQLVGERLKQG